MGNNNNRFRQTEHLFTHYNYYKAKIEEKKAEIAYLRQLEKIVMEVLQNVKALERRRWKNYGY